MPITFTPKDARPWPTSTAELDPSEQIIVRAFRHWVLGLQHNDGGYCSQVWNEFARQFEAATSEAAAAFGNGEVYLEKYVERPRHIEFQVMGDTHGNLVHLHERECSIQRRHQKLLEESPSPALDDGLRRFLAREDKGLRVDREAGRVWLSSIFDWFAEDFDAQGGVLAYLTPYAPEPAREWLAANRSRARIRYLDYDWHLNALDGCPPQAGPRARAQRGAAERSR